MPEAINLTKETQALLRCPVCHGELAQEGEALACAGPGCGARFPVVNGVPILINERNSLFAIDDYTSQEQTFFRPANRSRLKKLLVGHLPALSLNIAAEDNFREIEALLLDATPTARVLVVGGSVVGEGIGRLHQNPAIECVNSDVAFSPALGLVADGHDLPFADGVFDGVVITAVLEHVLDPFRCVEEVHRVLKHAGVVYAETPFMQQVHGGRYDFMRFTHLGHRRLFRAFEEIRSGVAVGPAVALLWAMNHFGISFWRSRLPRKMSTAFIQLAFGWLKHLDRFLAKRPAALDAASGCYFLGRKSDQVLSDKELIGLYRGGGSRLRTY